MDPAASKVTPLSPQADSANVAGVRFSCWEHSAARLLTQSDPPLPPNSLIPDACPPPPSSQKLWRAVEVGDREIMREKGTFPTLDAVAGGLKGAVRIIISRTASGGVRPSTPSSTIRTAG